MLVAFIRAVIQAYELVHVFIRILFVLTKWPAKLKT